MMELDGGAAVSAVPARINSSASPDILLELDGRAAMAKSPDDQLADEPLELIRHRLRRTGMPEECPRRAASRSWNAGADF
jgi:hypothetical protein